MRRKRNSKKKAFGLLEVIIAIAISAVVLMGSVVVATRSIKFVRRNELQDISNGILLRSLEISRSPIDFDLNQSLGEGAGPKSFVFEKQTIVQDINRDIGITDRDSNLGEERYVLVEIATQIGEIEVCDVNSTFRVDLLSSADIALYADDEFNTIYQICNQVQISEESNDGVRRVFKITSIIVYDLFGDQIRTELTSYRTEIVR